MGVANCSLPKPIQMKRTILFASCSILIAGMLNAQSVIFSEDFESYTAGSFVAASAGDPWTTWSGAPGGSEDVMISTDQAHSGTNSVEFEGAAGGGPGDIVLKLGDRTTGMYALNWWMYVPTGNGAYFNIQHDETPGIEWGLDVMFLAGGTIEVVADDATDATTTYPHDAWFEVTMIVDLAMMQGAFVVDQNDPITWAFNTQVTGGAGMNQLGAINFFTYAGGVDVPHYYLDDVSFIDLTNVSVTENSIQHAVLYPNPVNDILTVEVPTSSGTAVVSVIDVTGRTVVEGASFMQQGQIARTQLDMSGMPQGLYMIRIQDGASESVHRVVRN